MYLLYHNGGSGPLFIQHDVGTFKTVCGPVTCELAGYDLTVLLCVFAAFVLY